MKASARERFWRTPLFWAMAACVLSLATFELVERAGGAFAGGKPMAAGAIAAYPESVRSPAAALESEPKVLPSTHPGEVPVQAGSQWLRISPRHLAGTQPLLEIRRNDWREIRLFEVKETAGGRVIVQSEEERPSPARGAVGARHPVLFMDSSADTAYWILHYTSAQPGVARFLLWQEPADFVRYQHRHDATVAGYLGLLTFAWALNLFAFATSRTHAYAYYAGFLFFHAVSTIGYEGIDFGLTSPHLGQLLMLSIPLSAIFVLQFSTRYFALAIEAPRWHRTLRVFQAAALLLLAQAAFIDLPPIWHGFIRVQSLFVLVTIWFLVGLGFERARSGAVSDLIYLVAFIPHIMAVSSFLLQRFGVLPPDPFFYQKLLLASTVEITLLAFGLTLVIRRAQQVRDSAQKAKIAYLQMAREAELSFRRELEETVARRTADLARSNEEKDELLSVLAHDLRSPLNSIVRISECVLPSRASASKSELLEVLQGIHRTGRSLYQLLENLLRWARPNTDQDASASTCCDLHQVLERALPLYTSILAEKDITLDAVPDPAEWPLIVAPPDTTDIVMRNLLSNAFRHATEASRVRCEVQHHRERVYFSIFNEGKPIDSATIQRFQRERAMETRWSTGSGLGLRLCRDLVEREGGSLVLEAVDDRGTRATVDFQMAE